MMVNGIWICFGKRRSGLRQSRILSFKVKNLIPIFLLFVFSCSSQDSESLEDRYWNEDATCFPNCYDECLNLSKRVLLKIDTILISGNQFWFIDTSNVFKNRKRQEIFEYKYLEEIRNELDAAFQKLADESLINVWVELVNKKSWSDGDHYNFPNSRGMSLSSARDCEKKDLIKIGEQEFKIEAQYWQFGRLVSFENEETKFQNVLEFSYDLDINEEVRIEVRIRFDCFNNCFTKLEESYFDKLNEYFFDENKGFFQNETWNLEKLKTEVDTSELNFNGNLMELSVSSWESTEKGLKNFEVVKIKKDKKVLPKCSASVCEREQFIGENNSVIRSKTYGWIPKSDFIVDYNTFTIHDTLNNVAITVKVKTF